ncbi:hypothetical protein VK792_17640, partial [Mesobacterium sp. TK19101]
KIQKQNRQANRSAVLPVHIQLTATDGPKTPQNLKLHATSWPFSVNTCDRAVLCPGNSGSMYGYEAFP